MLKVLQKITQEVNAASSMEDALALVVHQVCDAMQADACSVFLCDDARGEYILMATLGLDPEQVGKARLKYGEGLVGLVGEREEPINVDNAPQHPNFFKHQKISEAEFKGFLGVPIIEQGELLGVLIIQQCSERYFSEDEEAFAITLAIQLAPGIARAKARGLLADLDAGKRRGKTETVLTGVSGAHGIAMGTAVVIYPLADLDAVPDRDADSIDAEIQAFSSALHNARHELHDIQERAKELLSPTEHAIFEAYIHILDSPSLRQEVEQHIRHGLWAQAALKRVIQRHVMQLESLEDPYLRERATDFRDLGRRILSQLQSQERAHAVFPKDCILVCDEVTATSLMEVPAECLRGVISGSGSGNSHVAILARALGLPTVMGVTGTPLDQLAEKECIVDGYNGQIFLSPSASVKREYRLLAEEEHQLDAHLESQRQLPAVTPDQHTLSLYINTGLAVEGGMSLSVGAEGVGLYRTELPFMMRDRFPSEEEQRVMYQQLLSTFAPRPVVMRTLDIGGDKALPYFHIKEANPFLGWRGIRVTLSHPEIFLQQVRAMLHASEGLNNLSIMLPMIASVGEVEAALALINQAYDELTAEGLDIQRPAIGLMIEVPAAVYQAYELAMRVDFLSVGSNDLIQYLLAVDRNNPRVARLYDGFHPAVLRALIHVVKASHKAGKPISICGELAGEPIAALMLMAMGFDTLSMNARSLPRVKWVVRSFTLKHAQQLLEDVLNMDDPREIRQHLENALEEAGLGSLIRAGR